MPDLAHKLGIKPGHIVGILNAPPGALDLLRQSCPPGVTLSEALDNAPYDAIIFWPVTLDGLTRLFADLQQRITVDGAVWAVIPKKAQAARRGVTFTWEQMQQAGLQTDMVDNKVASFSGDDYATRFVIRKQKRRR